MPRRQLHIIPILSIVLLAMPLAMANSAEKSSRLSIQRADFLAAEKALTKGDMKGYNRYIQKLQNYPLLPYLEYQRLKKNIRALNSDEIESFLTRYAATPLSGLLRNRWLNTLAKRGKWWTYLSFYKARNSKAQQCNYVNALFNTRQSTTAMPMVKEIWLSGRSQPKECDAVFKRWSELGGRTNELVWQRINLAMQRNNSRMARYLGRFLPEKERPWLDQWLKLHRDPQSLKNYVRTAEDHPYKKDIILHGFKRLTVKNIDLALESWSKTNLEKHLSDKQIYKAKRKLALRLAWGRHQQAIPWLDQLEVEESDHRLHETRIRTALIQRDWSHAQEWINKLPDPLKRTERWRYWQARTLEHLGNPTKANRIFHALAKERSYHGFLAADHLGTSYKLDHTPLKLTNELLEKIRQQPGMIRARELLHHDRRLDARREWQLATQKLNRKELQAAAKIAQSWEWHDRAIFTLAKTDHWDDLELRFPLEHKKQINIGAKKQQLDHSWIYAVVRQESAFAHDAVSPAGARGLMQLMPRTAKLVAKKLKLGRFRKSDLFNPITNIMLGTKYLRQVWDQLGKHQVLATAAYNAGPRRVKSWLPKETTESALWIETIPFKETRTYTQRVLTYSVIYDSRRGKKPIRITERMRPINPLTSGKMAVISENKGRKL